MNYKLRAECSKDVLNFLNKTHNEISSLKMIRDGGGFPDVEFEFETKLSLNKIFSILHGIEDTHVMRQTIKPIEEYTGERNYDL